MKKLPGVALAVLFAGAAGISLASFVSVAYGASAQVCEAQEQDLGSASCGQIGDKIVIGSPTFTVGSISYPIQAMGPNIVYGPGLEDPDEIWGNQICADFGAGAFINTSYALSYTNDRAELSTADGSFQEIVSPGWIFSTLTCAVK